MKIAFFDSGLGGLTVVSAAMKELPTEDFVYFADTLHVPYGTKPKEEVKEYIHRSIETLMQEDIKAIVIACNTATSLTVTELRNTYSIPIIGMEPAVKPAVQMNLNTSKRVIVFATPLTLSQSKYIELVTRVDEAHIVDSIPLPELVEYCEALNFDKQVITEYFIQKLQGYNLDEYGTIVLGCTHYPFYKQLLKEIVPKHLQIIDGRRGTVNRLLQVIKANDLASPNGHNNVQFLCSSQSNDYIQKMEKALNIFREVDDFA